MGTLTVIEKFRKQKRLKLMRSAEIHRLPERPAVFAKQIWICDCGEENDESKCWNCGKDRVLG